MRAFASAAIAALIVNLTIAEPGLADDAGHRSGQVQAISDQGVLTLTGGQELCFGDVWLGGEGWPNALKAKVKTTLGALIDGKAVRIDDGAEPWYNRYGCLVAHLETDDGRSLQEALLARGLAIVKPSLSSSSMDRSATGRIDGWLDIENEARTSGLGLWRDETFRPKKAAPTTDHVGRFDLVEGRVVRVSSNDCYVYLNFGRDWRTDFTVRVRKKLLEQDGRDPQSFEGRPLRVRGFIQEARGPLIDISHLKQIEVMP